MAFVLDTEVYVGQNIAPNNSFLCLDYTVTRNVRVGICLRLMNLGSGGATFSIKVETYHASGEIMDTMASTTIKWGTDILRYRLEHDRLLFLPDATRIKVYLSSTNTNDTSVDVTSFLFDAHYPTPTADVEARDSETVPSIPSTAAAYAIGDAIGGQMTFNAGANRGNVIGCRVIDKAENTAPVELWLFRTSTTSGLSDNMPFDPDDNQIANLAGVLRIDDWFATTENTVGQATNRPLAFADLTNSELFGWLVTRGTPTYAQNNLVVELEILPNTL